MIIFIYFVQGFNNITRLEIKIPTKNGFVWLDF